MILYKYSILVLAFTHVYEDKGRLNFYLIRDELTIGNFHGLELGCQTSPIQEKGFCREDLIWVADPC